VKYQEEGEENVRREVEGTYNEGCAQSFNFSTQRWQHIIGVIL
jgi:hypothetical protein